MDKLDLSNLSILIPVRLDSLDRLENLLYVSEFILKYCETNIFILHADKKQRKYLRFLLNPKCNYSFVEDIDPVFHRTFYINQLFKSTDTEVIAIWDADVIIHPSQMLIALEKIMTGHYDIYFPYDGTFLNVDNLLKETFQELSFDIDFLIRNKSKMLSLYKDEQNGGAIFISRKAFLNSGMENESFYGWGPEDWNRVEKWKILNFRIGRAEGPLFHLHHNRDINGSYRSFFQRKNCSRLLNITRLSTPKMLAQEYSQNHFVSEEVPNPILELFK